MAIIVREAWAEELMQINGLRKMVNDIHVANRPDVFRPGFCDELKQHLYEKYRAPDSNIFVAVTDGAVCGFAIVEYVEKPLSPFNNARKTYHVHEFGVDEKARRKGVATALMNFIKADARSRGYDRIDLSVWEFNGGALSFYESAGFQTCRRYMEMEL